MADEKKGWIPDLRAARDKKARERSRKDQDTESIDDLILQGRLTRAQQFLELRVAENDQDVHSHIKLAELLAGKRKTEDALRNYLRAAQLLSEDGFFDKSLALLKTRAQARGQRHQQHRRHGRDRAARQGARLRRLGRVRKGKSGEAGARMSASIELEALWRRM